MTREEQVVEVPTLPDWAIQVLQVLAVLMLAPLVSGVIARAEAVVQQRRGPRVLQPYYDIFKLLQKETVLPDPAGPVCRAAPYVSFAAYATVPLLIPALTTFGLTLGWMADFFGVGMILALASWVVSWGRWIVAAPMHNSGQAACVPSGRSTSRR